MDNGWWWLLGLFMLAVGYIVSQQVWGVWQRWRTFQDKSEKIADLLLAAGRGDIIRQCALIRRIIQQGQVIRISSVSSTDLVVIEVNQLALREDDELKGTKWALMNQNGGGQMVGEVIGCDGRLAHEPCRQVLRHKWEISRCR